MPAFSPNGFSLLNDATVSSPMDVSTFVGEINPDFSYFAGDIATLAIFNSNTDNQTVFPGGYIYPYPIKLEITGGSPDPLALSYSKLGVFQYFEYTPASTKIPVQSSNFIAGTQVAPYTKILATVTYSPTATFRAQIKTDTITPTGVPRNWLYTQMTVGCDTTYTVALEISPGETFDVYFPLGNSNSFQGGSLSYLMENPGMEDQYELTTPVGFASVLFNKMTDLGGSGFSTNSNIIPNPIVQCTLTNNSLIEPLGNF